MSDYICQKHSIISSGQPTILKCPTCYANLERENERLRDGLKSQSAVLSRIDYLCGEPNDMEVSGYDVHCNEDAVLVAVRKLRAQLEAAEALLKDAFRHLGTGNYNRRRTSLQIADYFCKKDQR